MALPQYQYGEVRINRWFGTCWIEVSLYRESSGPAFIARQQVAGELSTEASGILSQMAQALQELASQSLDAPDPA